MYILRCSGQGKQNQGLNCNSFEMTFTGQDNDFTKTSCSLTLFETILATYYMHYLHAMPFLNFCVLLPQNFNFTCCLVGSPLKLP